MKVTTEDCILCIRRGSGIRIPHGKGIWETLVQKSGYVKCLAVAEMGDRLATIDMGRKGGCCVPFGGTGRLVITDMGRKLGATPPFEGESELGSRLTQCRLG